MHIPDEAMEAGFGGENLLRAHPVHGDGILGGDFLHGLGLVGAGEAAHHAIFSASKISSFTGSAAMTARSVIDDGAVGRVLAGRLFRRERRIGVGFQRSGTAVWARKDARCQAFTRRPLPQRGDVVENPE